MSFGAGHLGRSVQANLKLKGERKTYFDRTPGKIRKPKRIRIKRPRPKMTLHGLSLFRKQLQQERRRVRLKRWGIVLLIMSWLLILLYHLNDRPF